MYGITLLFIKRSDGIPCLHDLFVVEVKMPGENVNKKKLARLNKIAGTHITTENAAATIGRYTAAGFSNVEVLDVPVRAGLPSPVVFDRPKDSGDFDKLVQLSKELDEQLTGAVFIMRKPLTVLAPAGDALA